MSMSSTCAAAAATATRTSERSFLRHIIPLRLEGSGSFAALYRHAFIHQEALIHRVLGALEAVPLPAAPRILFAEGFQRMLEGQSPQREVRGLFEEAEVAARRVLLDAELYAADARRRHDGELYAAVRCDPLTRLLAYELRAACGYYAKMLAVSSGPEENAAALLRTLIASDIRADPLLVHSVLRFEALPRNTRTGERLSPVEPVVDEFVKECVLLERDAFGRFRFDARGDNRHLMHCIKLDDVSKTPKAFAVVIDPMLQEYGNFKLERELVHQGRWIEHRLSCGEESHRVDEKLPRLETVNVRSDKQDNNADENDHVSFIVWYNEPICRRHKETTREREAQLDHTEVFELAVEDANRTCFERWFMDR